MTLEKLKAELKTAQEEMNNAGVVHISDECIEHIIDKCEESIKFDCWLADQKKLIDDLETKILLLS